MTSGRSPPSISGTQASIQRASGLLGIPEPQLAAMVRAARARYSAVNKVRFVPLKKDVPLEVVVPLEPLE